MCNLIAVLESKCRGCEYKHPNGCLRSNHLDRETAHQHISYYGEGGMTVMVTDKGTVIYLIDIEWCDKWSNNE